MSNWVLNTPEGASFALTRFPAALGREGVAGLAVALTDPRVSRRHAEIYEEKGQLFVRDLRSRNGTFVNGTRIEGTAAIRPGDTVRVGNTELALVEGATPLDTSRCEVSSAYDLDDNDTRAVPFATLQRAASQLAAQTGQAVRPEHASAGVLYALARSVAGLREPEEIVDAVIGITADVLAADHAAVFEIDGRGGLRALAGAPGGRAEALTPAGASATLIWRALRLQEAVLYDARRGQQDLSVSAETLLLRSAIAMPLCVGDRTIGVLYADTRREDRPLGDAALELMGGVALQAAASLEAARQHREVEEARAELDEANSRLREWGRELERRVHERTQELVEKSKEIEELLAEKDDLLRMVAHDLRTPLAGLVGYAQIAETDVDAGDLGAVRERLQLIVEIGKRSAYLLDDLLTAESIRSGKLEVKARPADVAALLDKTRAAIAPQARERGVEVRIGVPAGLGEARLDAGRVSQVLDNLAANAVKAVGRGGAVELRAARDGDALVLEVKDDGPGLEKALAERARDGQVSPGARVRSSHGRGGRGAGFGLGLKIAQKLARLVGGELTIASGAEGAGEAAGTVVRLRLPTAFAPPGTSASGASGGLASEGGAAASAAG